METMELPWTRYVTVGGAQVAYQQQLRSEGATRRSFLQAGGMIRPNRRSPRVMRLQAATPEHLPDLAPRLRLKPFGLYVRTDSDPAFENRGSVVGLDPGTDLSDWQRIDCRDERGCTASTTTTPGEAGHVLITLSERRGVARGHNVSTCRPRSSSSGCGEPEPGQRSTLGRSTRTKIRTPFASFTTTRARGVCSAYDGD